MAFKTLSQLRQLVRQAADIEQDGNHTTDSEVDGYINRSIEVLLSLVVDGTDGALLAKNAGLLVDLGGPDGNSYQLPSDFGHLISVDILVNGRYSRSTDADPQEMAQLAVLPYVRHSASRHFLRWNIEQGRAELFIYPKPTNLSDIAVQYVPSPPVLSLDSDTLNLPTFWYQWCVFDAAIQCALKEESDASQLANERTRIEQRIRDHVRSMIPTRVKTIRSVARASNRLVPPDIFPSSGS